VEEQTILVLIQIVEANGTLQPTHDSGKSDGADRVVVVTASRWQGLLVFLIVATLLDRLLLGHLLFSRLSFLRKGTSLAFKDSLYEKSL
jgi:hypothetical protein